ncbi:hypothetical protein [Amycolatopsis vastitatis]|uniref:Uncharacterized protein n=1 Tax=Amycolatopsis vastitatis TaxID=1905142 RepID=A0A229TFT9_9PSEU|nr:hypothetical protein [Amycolatopsis vastitatis]OXM69609.1 hypothetical protein CF165_08860 [Amycolatopsis vastitatis]
MVGIRYLVIDPDGSVAAGHASTPDEFADVLRAHVGDAPDVERIDVDVDLTMYRCRRAFPPAPANLVAAVVVTAHWGRAPEQYTGTVVFSGGGPNGHEFATLSDDAERYVRGLAAFACRRSGLPGGTPR